MNRWDKKYAENDYLFGTEPNAFLQTFSTIFPTHSKIAAYAEGEGRNAVFLASQGHNVVAYDYSSNGLNKAQQLAAQKEISIQTKLVDLEVEPLKEKYYDGAILIFGHFSKDFQLPILNKIMNSINTNGYFLMEVYEEGQATMDTGGPNDTNHLYNAETILHWAKQYEIKHFFTGEVERNEGFRHTGVCRVIQLMVKNIER